MGIHPAGGGPEVPPQVGGGFPAEVPGGETAGPATALAPGINQISHLAT